jgi:hypothetical protein
MSENDNTKSTLSDALTESADVKPVKKQASALDEQSALDMFTSAIAYMRGAGITINIRNSAKHGAVVTMPNIQALQNDLFEPLSNDYQTTTKPLPN